MKILIGTKNPGKIEGARLAFVEYFENIEIEGIPVNSEVSDEPVNDDIFKGAKNRVNNLIKYADENQVDADFYIAIESGITNRLGKWCILQIAIIRDKNGYESFGVSSAFPVPDKYVDEIINSDLGKLMDKLFNKEHIGNRGGGVSLLTKEIITRYDLTKEAFIMALTQHINGEVWK